MFRIGSAFSLKILGLFPTLASCTKSYLKLLTRAKIPHGMTINPTSRSATARDTIKKLVEVCRLFSLLTLNITAQFPTTAISGRKTVTKLKKFRWRGCVTSESESSVTFWQDVSQVVVFFMVIIQYLKYRNFEVQNLS